MPPYVVVAHEPAVYTGINTVVMKYKGMSDRVIKHIAHAYRIVYHANTTITDALYRIDVQVPKSSEIEYIMAFIRNSTVGIIS